MDSTELDNDTLAPNFALRDLIHEWDAKYCKTTNSSHVTTLGQMGRGSVKNVYRAELRVPGSTAPRIVAAVKVPSTSLAAEVSRVASVATRKL